mgnify:CR=1 FL=1
MLITGTPFKPSNFEKAFKPFHCLGIINLNDDSTVKSFTIASLDENEKKDLTADAYVSAMPVDLFKLMIPKQWKGLDAFSKLDGLNGVPVINIHLWFDKKLTDIDHLLY